MGIDFPSQFASLVSLLASSFSRVNAAAATKHVFRKIVFSIKLQCFVCHFPENKKTEMIFGDNKGVREI